MKALANVLLALTLAVPEPASAQAAPQALPCAPAVEVIAELASSYGEYPVWRGVSNDQETLVTVFENEKIGTWTAVATGTNRRSCLLSSGDHSARGLPL